MADRPRGQSKGAAFREFVNWYRDRVDSAWLNDTVERLARSHPGCFDAERPAYGILASRWYDADVVHELIDSLIEPWAESELDARALEAAEYIMGKTLSGIYRTMFSMIATPSRYARHVQKFWNQHYDTGRVMVETTSPGLHQVGYDQWDSHHRFICRMNMASGQTIYAAMGCRDASWERIGCVADGAPKCRSVVRWSEP